MTTATDLHPREIEESYRRHVASAADPRPALKWMAEHPDFVGYVLRLHELAETGTRLMATGTLGEISEFVDVAHAALADLPVEADDDDSWWRPHWTPLSDTFIDLGNRLEALRASLQR